jgi:O-antigen/teichoic acid export membrane protein
VGIIQRQTFRGTIWAYLGVVIGFVTTVLIYPNIFSTDEIGLLRLLVAYSALFAQFATLGFTRVATMLFPYFRNYDNNHNGFFPLALLVSLTGLVLAVILLLLFKPLILEKGGDNPALFVSYFYYIIPLLVFTLAFLILDNYYKVLYNAVQGTFLKDFLQRILILSGALLFLFSLITFETFVWIFLLAFLIPAVVLFGMLFREKQISMKKAPGFVSKDLRKKMIEVSFFGILTSFSGLLVLNIDSIMINAILDLSNTGIYAITFFFGTVILIPSRSLLKISSVIIADSWKKEDLATINTIYYKSCLNQMILASLLFIGIWANIHNIFQILPPKYEAGKYVIFFISLSAVIQMAGGTSNMILFTSPRYRVHTWFMLVLVGLLVLSNLILIPIYGITGAALASALSFLVYNMLKYFYLKRVYRLKPYDYRILVIVLIATGTYFLNLLLPPLHHYILDILVRSTGIALIYVLIVYLTGLSEDLQGAVNRFIKSNQ